MQRVFLCKMDSVKSCAGGTLRSGDFYFGGFEDLYQITVTIEYRTDYDIFHSDEIKFQL